MSKRNRDHASDEWCPYWAVRTLPTRRFPLPVVLMKDGTLCMGLRVHGLDTHSMQRAQLEGIAGRLGSALKTIPPDGYVQAVFETGDDYAELIQDYRTRSAPDSHSLLRRSRELRGQACEAASRGLKPRLTYWLGWKCALRGVDVSKKASNAELLTIKRLLRAAQGLADFVDNFVQGLAGAELTSEFLDESGLLDELHRAVNPTLWRETKPPFYVSTPEDLNFADDRANAPMLMERMSLAYQLPLEQPEFEHPSIIRADKGLLRVLRVARFPTTTKADWPNWLMYEKPPATPFRLVVTHVGTDKILRMEKLTKRKKELFSAIGERFHVPEDLEAAYEAHRKVLADTAQTDATVFDTSVQVVVSGRNEYELDCATDNATTAMAENNTHLATRRHEQFQGWLQSLPGYGYSVMDQPLLRTRQVLTQNAAHFLPYWIPTTDSDAPDLLMQTRQGTWRGFSPSIIRKRDDASGLIIGKTGSGKTFLFTLLMKLGFLDRGGHVILTDVKGPKNSSYKPLCELLDGLFICLDLDNSVSFNPFPERELYLKAQSGQWNNEDAKRGQDAIQQLVTLLCIMGVPDCDTNPDRDLYKHVLRDVLRLTYEAQENRHVMLEDMVRAFGSYKPIDEKFGFLGRDLARRLNTWCGDPKRARLLNRPEPFNVNNRFMVFDFANMDSEADLASVLVATLSQRIWDKLGTLPLDTPKLFGQDEAWLLYGSSKMAADLAGKAARTGRSYGAVCLALTQHHNDVLNTPVGQAVMANSSMLYLMRHVADHENVGKQFELTPREQHLFENLHFVGGSYAEALVKDKNRNLTEVVRYSPTAFDLWCDTSRPADVQKRRNLLKRPGATLLGVIEELARDCPNGAEKSEKELEEDFDGRQKGSVAA
jgi:hypothetical protein